ncbi:Protein Wnt-5b [Amphibalanus amphitrite]|uniref:Protein Wnt n=1 Tax=Amphibalanus amphitrite TaxID=1232801 RepID=A0A6A4W4P5_AMPAM|nr:Protein Wnt-5b [Amphibalanus amphitrite]
MRSLGLQGLDVWRSPQMYVVGTSPLCARIPGLSPGQRRLCQLRQVSRGHGCCVSGQCVSGRPADLDPDWTWGGCGDNIAYGYRFARTFADIRERERRFRAGSRRQARALMNIHNNRAGAKSVISLTKVNCRCHGVSGSCSAVTCWQRLPAFREVGDMLKDKYDGATKVRVTRRSKLRVRNKSYRQPTADDLVYIRESPDYCRRNATLGSSGTAGRTCVRGSKGTDGCDLLCCGRGYNTQRVTVTERCRCKFVWCCKVQCHACTRRKTLHTCK